MARHFVMDFHLLNHHFQSEEEYLWPYWKTFREWAGTAWSESHGGLTFICYDRCEIEIIVCLMGLMWGMRADLFLHFGCLICFIFIIWMLCFWMTTKKYHKVSSMHYCQEEVRFWKQSLYLEMFKSHSANCNELQNFSLSIHCYPLAQLWLCWT